MADGVTYNLVVHNMTTGDEKLYSRPGLRGGPARWFGSNTEFLQLLATVPLANQTSQFARSFYSVNLPNGVVREVVAESTRSGVAALSPDGKTLYQFARDPQRLETFTRLVAVDLATAQERTVLTLDGTPDTLPRGAGVALAVSPDGKTLAVATQKGKPSDVYLSRVGIDGTQSRELFGPFTASAVNDRLAWTRDGRSILFAMTDDDWPAWKIMRIGAEGGSPEFTGVRANSLGPFSVSPDGTRIAFTSVGANESELWAIDVSWVWAGKR